MNKAVEIIAAREVHGDIPSLDVDDIGTAVRPLDPGAESPSIPSQTAKIDIRGRRSVGIYRRAFMEVGQNASTRPIIPRPGQLAR